MSPSKKASPLAASQVPALRALVLSLARYYLAPGQTQLPEWLQATFTEEAFARRLADKRFYHRVLLIDGELAGYIALHTTDSDTFHLYHLFVDARFQRQGVAKQLWQLALNELGFSTCSLRSSLFAVPVYQRFGFVVNGELQEKDGLQFQPMVYGE